MTIRGRGIHVIPDIAKATELPADLSTAKDIGVAFYAGYPVESPSGEPIGALCVFDAKPRLRANVDEGLLRQLALLIQAELRVESLSA
jgi:GAF domain-containing protein